MAGSFEPDPHTMAALRRNVSANRVESLVTSIECAVGSHNGRAGFTKGLDCINHVVEGGAERTVALVALDDAVEDPTFLKIDVEGHESEVVKGARKTLGNPSLIAIETESRAIVPDLESFAFLEYVYDPFHRALTRGSAAANRNALLIRDYAAAKDRVVAAAEVTILGKRF